MMESGERTTLTLHHDDGVPSGVHISIETMSEMDEAQDTLSVDDFKSFLDSLIENVVLEETRRMVLSVLPGTVEYAISVGDLIVQTVTAIGADDGSSYELDGDSSCELGVLLVTRLKEGGYLQITVTADQSLFNGDWLDAVLEAFET